MTVQQLRSQLSDLIQGENNVEILQAMVLLLQRPRVDPVLKEKLSARAMAAEEDIKHGRVHDRAAVEAHLKTSLGI